MAVLPTGLDDSFYIEDEEKTKTNPQTISWGREKTDILFCSVSRLEEEKNRYFFLNGIRCFEREAAIFVSCAASG